MEITPWMFLPTLFLFILKQHSFCIKTLKNSMVHELLDSNEEGPVKQIFPFEKYSAQQNKVSN